MHAALCYTRHSSSRSSRTDKDSVIGRPVLLAGMLCRAAVSHADSIVPILG